MTAISRRQAFNMAVREDFLCFLQRAFSHLNRGQVFEPEWHLSAIAHRLEVIQEKGGGRLIINVPPRSLKSVTISVAWVAWMLGQDPRLRFICASYSADLSLKLARDCRELMQAAWYLSAFPHTRLARTAEQDFTTTVGGGRMSTSVEGTLTGRGGDIIIDDPMKPDVVSSETTRRRTIEWYNGTVSSRLDNKRTGSIILVMQRLHEVDLAGHLLEAGGWDHLNLPAIAEDDEAIEIGPGEFHVRKAGELLSPVREPQWVLDGQKGTMGSVLFSAQYQQRPVPAEGNIVKAEWLRIYEVPPELQRGDQIFQSWDCATKDGVMNDYSVCITALVRHRQVYVLDVLRKRLTFPDLLKATKERSERSERYNADAVLIEDAASGAQLIQTLRATPEAGVSVIKITPDGDKASRLSGVTAGIEAGDLLLPDEAPWLGDFKHELLAFPGGRHDDQVDALSQLLARVRRHPGPSASGDASIAVYGQYFVDGVAVVGPYIDDDDEKW